MSDWLKAKIRAFLGLDLLLTERIALTLAKMQNKHDQEILAAVLDLGKRLEAAHVFDKVKPRPKVWDYEQVQAATLQKALDDDLNRKEEDA